MSDKKTRNERRRVSPEFTVPALMGTSIVLALILILLTSVVPVFDLSAVYLTSAVWLGIVAIVVRHVRYHPHSTFGYANLVTTVRAAATSLLAGCISIAAVVSNTSSMTAWLITAVAALALCLDGLDGHLARKTRQCSAFGARYDMETDAFLALVITLVLWQSEKVGIWVIGLGILRYVFLLASVKYSQLQAELFPSMRRKTVCVIQVGALCLMLCPWVSAPFASVVGVIALACLVWSFTVDVVWLLNKKPVQVKPTQVRDVFSQEREESERLKSKKSKPGTQPNHEISA